MDDPYQLLLNLARDEFQGEVDRVSRVENKSFGLLSTLTIIIGIYGAVLGWLVQHLHNINDWHSWLIICFAALVLLFLVVSWFYLFRAITVDKRAYLSVDDSLVEFYEQNSLMTVNYYMTNQFRKAAEKNRSVTHCKVKNLSRGYWAIIASGLLLLILLVLLSMQVWNTNSSHDAASLGNTTEAHSNE